MVTYWWGRVLIKMAHLLSLIHVWMYMHVSMCWDGKTNNNFILLKVLQCDHFSIPKINFL